MNCNLCGSEINHKAQISLVLTDESIPKEKNSNFCRSTVGRPSVKGSCSSQSLHILSLYGNVAVSFVV